MDVQLGDQVEREMTILFSDIRGFTSLSEQMTPSENFRFINSYLGRMEPSIIAHHGFIDKFIGDAIMALFPTNADDGLNGAIDMFKALEEYNQHRQSIGYVPIKIGVGLNTGPLMLGTVGGKNRMDGTVISDAVNLSSRIEGMNKTYGTSLLIGENTWKQLKDPSQYLMRLIGRVKARGKKEPLCIYEVLEVDELQTIEQKIMGSLTFEKGLVSYQQQEFSEAKSLFGKCLTICSQDKVAELYIKRCNHFIKYGWDENWSGDDLIIN